MAELIWVIPALPLIGFVTLLVLGRRLGEPGAGWLATAMVGGSFLVTGALFLHMLGNAAEERVLTQTLFSWIPAGGFNVDVGFLADPLSVTMSLFITGIATLIHLYAIGYMHGDEKFSKFFIYLNLFVFSMLMLVLGDNMLVTFLGWEGVGACSYLLISFWHTSEANASAGKKAFVTNRIGDWGYMMALFLTFTALGSVRYTDFAHGISGLSAVTATAITVLLLVAATGKSAQLPLFVWLPDAMAGPTPVSALIHAATMVTSGVYLLTRMSPIISEASPWAPSLIAWVGVLTALVAATIAVAQNDIKKVLAYSTVSQLGYMFLAIGSGAYVAAIFHMVTHAFFKALMFLGSGSVIHGMGGEQDMRRMGALRKALPITAATYIVGWLAIAGVPPFSGFWSKDEILLFAFDKSPLLWLAGIVTAILTAFYMSRQVFMTFFGKPRWEESHSPHESPWTMTVPLVVLSVLALVGGAMQLPFKHSTKRLESWLEPVIGHSERHIVVSSGTKGLLIALAVLGAFVGIGLAVALFARRPFDEQPEAPALLAQGWRYDSTIAALMGGPGRRFFEAVAWFDRTVVDGAVNGVASTVRGVSDGLRRTQTGFVRAYVGVLTGGAILLVMVVMVRGALL